MKNAIAGPREVVGHVVHGRHQSTVSENSASHIQTSKQPVEDKMEPMNFMGRVVTMVGLRVLIFYLTYVKHKPSSRMIVLVIIVFSSFLSLKTVLLEIYFMN